METNIEKLVDLLLAKFPREISLIRHLVGSGECHTYKSCYRLIRDILRQRKMLAEAQDLKPVGSSKNENNIQIIRKRRDESEDDYSSGPKL